MKSWKRNNTIDKTSSYLKIDIFEKHMILWIITDGVNKWHLDVTELSALLKEITSPIVWMACILTEQK